jgi:hypothetical protein
VPLTKTVSIPALELKVYSETPLIGTSVIFPFPYSILTIRPFERRYILATPYFLSKNFPTLINVNKAEEIVAA